MMPPKTERCSNRRPAGQSDGSGKFGRDFCSRRAFPAVIAGR